jgi:hypothetical protein
MEQSIISSELIIFDREKFSVYYVREGGESIEVQYVLFCWFSGTLKNICGTRNTEKPI